MSDSSAHRRFKDSLYGYFADLGKALASPVRIEFLELLAQSERTVESLATETGVSLANASQHLQALRHAGLVESRKQGLFVHYRLADPAVVGLCAAIRQVAERRSLELQRLVREHFGDRAEAEAITMADLLKRSRTQDIIVIDTRPASEYAGGHIAGAISVPVDDLQRRLKELPKRKEFVAYCRGPYCVYADRAVEILHASGRRAKRLIEGFPEWQVAGFPVERGLEHEAQGGRP